MQVDMGKLSDELPIINVIKRRMKKDENFTNDQVRDFERRVGRTHSLRFLVEIVLVMAMVPGLPPQGGGPRGRGLVADDAPGNAAS